MSNKKTTKIRDYVPEFGLNGDFKKVSEYDFIAYNSKILPVLILCFMEKGTDQLNPEMGSKDLFMQLPFTEKDNVNSLITKINDSICKFTNNSVRVYVNDEKTNWLTGEITVNIDITGVPGEISLGVNKNSVNSKQPFNIKQPSVFYG